MDYYNYHRRKSSIVQIGNTPLGGEYPVRIQSMTNTSTLDTAASVDQCIRIIQAGADYVRLTAQGVREAENLGEIKRELIARGYTTPLAADIHFNPKAADAAAYTVDKVRINPGNFVDSARTFKRLSYTDEEYTAELQKLKERFIPFLNICKEQHTAIRLGVNHGSLSDRIMSRYGDTPEGMVESCMEFLRICRSENFDNVVISIKASNTVVMVRTVRLLIETMESEGMNYPLHLGVTEAGDGEDGRIKSSVGIGTLLADGIGDTIRVSLSEAPEVEIPVACKLVNYITARTGHKPITAPDVSLDWLCSEADEPYENKEKSESIRLDEDEMDGDDEDYSKEDRTQSLKVMGDYEGRGAHISANNRQDADYQVHDMSFVLNDEVDINYNADPVISREEAIQMTSEKLKDLTDKEWQVDSADNNGNQWRIKYVPVINNLPCLLTDLSYDSTDAYAANLTYEMLEFEIIDDQITSVGWDSPMEITSTDSQPAEMLPFDDIYTAFKNYMQVKCTMTSLGMASDDEMEDETTAETEKVCANVNDIRQMYCRVKVKNSDQAFEYVPVYVFSGYASQGDYKEDGWVNHFCVVNATDGTIINTWLGY